MSMTESGAPVETYPTYAPFGDDVSGNQEHWSGRMPPQDADAEQSVLGSMLISKDAIADVNEQIGGGDFYRPAHETIYDAVVDLYGRGEPADPVTVAAELQRRGELARVGGAPYLHTLSASVPIAANAGYYATIVREKAILRRLVDAGTKIAQLGYAGEGDVDATVDVAQQEIYCDRGEAPAGGLRAALGDHGVDRRGDRGDLQPRRRHQRGADRLLRPRRADQRVHRRPDGDRGRATCRRQVDAGSGFLPVGLDPQQPDQRDLQPGDVQERDRHAAALGRGEGAAQQHPQGPDDRRRLEQAQSPRWARSPVRRCSSTTAPT